MKIYDPIRDTNQALKARTKQKVYTKYEKLRQRAYSDSSCSEESDYDDPMREMLKSNIHKIYEENDNQLYLHGIKIKEKNELKNKYNPYNYDIYNTPESTLNPQNFNYIVQQFSQMFNSFYSGDMNNNFAPYYTNQQNYDVLNYSNNW